MTLRQPDFLQGLSPEEAATILALGSRRTLPGGAVLFDLGADADHLFLVESGRVTLTLPMQLGDRREDVLVEERLPGQMLGWSAVIPPHRFTLRAAVPLETRLVAFPRQALLDHFAANPSIGHVVVSNVAAIIGQRLQMLQAMWLREMQRLIELRCS